MRGGSSGLVLPGYALEPDGEGVAIVEERTQPVGEAVLLANSGIDIHACIEIVEEGRPVASHLTLAAQFDMRICAHVLEPSPFPVVGADPEVSTVFDHPETGVVLHVARAKGAQDDDIVGRQRQVLPTQIGRKDYQGDLKCPSIDPHSLTIFSADRVVHFSGASFKIRSISEPGALARLSCDRRRAAQSSDLRYPVETRLSRRIDHGQHPPGTGTNPANPNTR